MRQHSPHGSRLAFVFVSAVVFVTPAVTSAASQDIIDKLVGVWKLSSEKSHFSTPNPPTSIQDTLEKHGPNAIREVADVVTQDGRKVRQERVRTYDGKEHPVPDQPGVMETCEVLDTNTARCTQKQDGTVLLELLARLAEGGKTIYVQVTRFDQDGKPLINFAVYDKQ